MNKQEYICKLKKHLEAPSELEGTNFDVIYNKAIRRAIHLAEHLDEQEKPTVPQYVADYYESIKDDFEYNIYSLCLKFNTDNSDTYSDLWWWFNYGVNEPIKTLVKMDIFGYDVIGKQSKTNLDTIKESGFFVVSSTNNTPSHYQGTTQPIDLINAQNLNFNLGNVVKYVCRAGKKQGENILTDLEKAKDYINFEIERVKQ